MITKNLIKTMYGRVLSRPGLVECAHLSSGVTLEMRKREGKVIFIKLYGDNAALLEFVMCDVLAVWPDPVGEAALVPFVMNGVAYLTCRVLIEHAAVNQVEA